MYAIALYVCYNYVCVLELCICAMSACLQNAMSASLQNGTYCCLCMPHAPCKACVATLGPLQCHIADMHCALCSTPWCYCCPMLLMHMSLTYIAAHLQSSACCCLYMPRALCRLVWLSWDHYSVMLLSRIAAELWRLVQHLQFNVCIELK